MRILKRIPKNIGELIANPMDLKKLAIENKDVWHIGWGKISASDLYTHRFCDVIDILEKKHIYFLN
jgi:hypothetical protein